MWLQELCHLHTGPGDKSTLNLFNPMHQMIDASDWKDYGDLSPTRYQRLWEHPGWPQLLPNS